MKAVGKYIIIQSKEEHTTKTKGGLILGEDQREDIRYREGVVIKPGDEVKVLKEGDDMYIQWNSDKLTIFIWDANTEDGDKIDLVINGKEILNDFSTTKKRKKIKYKLKDGKNKIEIKAKNVGKNPPNTSRIELSDSKTKFPIITQLQVGKSAIITIVK